MIDKPSWPKEVVLSVEEGGWFCIDKNVRAKIVQSKLQGNCCAFTSSNAQSNNNSAAQQQIRDDSKIMHMVGYMYELTYDLCLCPVYNQSGSFGMEGVLGNFSSA